MRGLAPVACNECSLHERRSQAHPPNGVSSSSSFGQGGAKKPGLERCQDGPGPVWIWRYTSLSGAIPKFTTQLEIRKRTKVVVGEMLAKCRRRLRTLLGGDSPVLPQFLGLAATSPTAISATTTAIAIPVHTTLILLRMPRSSVVGAERQE
jgi:hypothetical protein